MKIEIIPSKRPAPPRGDVRLEVGKWYVESVNKEHLFYVTGIDDDMYSYTGWNVSGVWTNNDKYDAGYNLYRYKEADPNIVEKAMMKEAARRYASRDKIELGNYRATLDNTRNTKWFPRNGGSGALDYYGATVYQDGKWATKII